MKKNRGYPGALTRKGFTLVELLVAVAILGILLAIAIPVYNGITDNSNMKAFEANHSIIVSAINMYISAHNGEFPRKITDLTDNNYLINDSGKEIKLDGSPDGYSDNPKGAKYNLVCDENGKGFKLTSKFKEEELVYQRGTVNTPTP